MTLNFDQIVNFSTLFGLTLRKFKQTENDEMVLIETECGRSFVMTHVQDCCESVTLEDICGDVEDIIGSPLLVADERDSSNETEDGSETWTFYHLSTIRGSVVLRWLGESNGYYSESVDLYEVTAGGKDD